ncbi:MAG: flagellar hook-associated protein FlgK [Rhodospirillales bacterium]|jgi:flagellar hook-associated protein 1 FlgK|nr:flagellar hook-associated protein FlgK [Rhodospirillales bacterium]
MAMDAIGLALSGLDVTRARIDTLTRNITNAQTPGYTKKVDVATTGLLGQVQLGSVTRSVDNALLTALRSTTGDQNQLQSSVTLLSQVETSFGTPAASSSLSAQITGLQTAFQDLSVNPEKTSLLNNVIAAGDAVARTLNTLTQTVSQVSTNANAQLQEALTTVNTTLKSIATLNNQISTQSAGSDVTDLQDQRDNALNTLAGLMDITTFTLPSGAVSVYTKDGKPLVDPNVATVSLGGSSGLLWNSPPSAPAPIRVGSGTIAGILGIQTTTVPTLQGQLDDMARTLTVEFNAINVPLFSDNGTAPLLGTNPGLPISSTNPANPLQLAGYAGRIAVDQTVRTNPSIIHDGAVAPLGVSGPVVAGPALAPGDTSVIDQAVALFSRTNVAYTATGLPPTGNIIQVASDFVANQSTARANSQQALTSEQALVSALHDKISSASGVNVDDQVAQLTVLQNAYSANARVLQASKDMYTTLFNAI